MPGKSSCAPKSTNAWCGAEHETRRTCPRSNGRSQEVNANMRTTLEELQSAQQQLCTGKLASIGQLTAGIAHELNNPINFVSSSAQLAAGF